MVSTRSIRLALPDGREVNVDRTAQADERHSDLTFAINDAFNRARRQLQDHVRELQGQVKHHEGSPIGTVVRLDSSGELSDIRRLQCYLTFSGSFGKLAAQLDELLVFRQF